MTAWWRVAGLTLVTGTLTTLAHLVVASAAPGRVPAPSPAALLEVLLLSSTAVVVLGHLRLPGWQMAAGLTVTQFGQHLCLPTASHGSVHAGGHTAAMIAAHTAAGILTAALLGHGDAVVSALRTWLNWLRPVRLRLTPPGARPLRVLPVAAIRRRPLSALRCGPGLRGPPARLAPR